MGCLDQLIAVTAEIAIAKVIEEDEHDIGGGALMKMKQKKDKFAFVPDVAWTLVCRWQL